MHNPMAPFARSSKLTKQLLAAEGGCADVRVLAKRFGLTHQQIYERSIFTIIDEDEKPIQALHQGRQEQVIQAAKKL